MNDNRLTLFGVIWDLFLKGSVYNKTSQLCNFIREENLGITICYSRVFWTIFLVCSFVQVAFSDVFGSSITVTTLILRLNTSINYRDALAADSGLTSEEKAQCLCLRLGDREGAEGRVGEIWKERESGGF